VLAYVMIKAVGILGGSIVFMCDDWVFCRTGFLAGRTPERAFKIEGER